MLHNVEKEGLAGITCVPIDPVTPHGLLSDLVFSLLPHISLSIPDSISHNGESSLNKGLFTQT